MKAKIAAIQRNQSARKALYIAIVRIARLRMSRMRCTSPNARAQSRATKLQSCGCNLVTSGCTASVLDPSKKLGCTVLYLSMNACTCCLAPVPACSGFVLELLKTNVVHIRNFLEPMCASQTPQNVCAQYKLLRQTCVHILKEPQMRVQCCSTGVHLFPLTLRSLTKSWSATPRSLLSTKPPLTNDDFFRELGKCQHPNTKTEIDFSQN